MSELSSELQFFADFIETELGIVYGSSNAFQLERRLEEIRALMEVQSLPALVSKARAEGIRGDFRQLLLDTATNNETSFFRDIKVFKALGEFVFPQLIEANPSKKLLRFWCAACSTGQEPYSVAMMMLERREKDPNYPRADILATDISDRAMERARSGIYSQLEVQRGLPARLMVKFFKEEAEDKNWKISAEARASVRIEEHNLLSFGKKRGPFDLVMCRNVLIYQNKERKEKIISDLLESLNPGGFLVLGAAESLLGISDQVEQLVHEGAILYRKRGA